MLINKKITQYKINIHVLAGKQYNFNAWVDFNVLSNLKLQ